MTSSIDRKRINGPERSVVPLPLVADDATLSRAVRVLNVHGKRADGRDPEAMRPIFMQTGTISKADGSAYIEQANTKVVCAVYGPRPDRKMTDPDQGRLAVEFRLATFAQPKRRGFVKDVVEKEYSRVVAEALSPAVRLDSFPKASVDVHVTVLQDDGTLAAVAAAITAASLALADAGIELFDLVSGAAAAFADDNTILMDPAADEEKLARGSLLLAFMSNVSQVSQLIQSGNVQGETAEEAMDYCIDTAAEIHTLMQECLSHAAAAAAGAASDDEEDEDAMQVVKSEAEDAMEVVKSEPSA
ncbi:3'-5'-exoribonuclease [Blastocladiella emersonii ATCC 22665]|nr:3'-5'-exoribonuclease [Blastocladiella emersonii ATCC 22665]